MLIIQPPPPPPPVEDDPLGALYELAASEQTAAQSDQIDDSPRCPQCATGVGAGAVICVNCGYDFRTKRKVMTVKAAPERAPEVKGGKKKNAPVVDYEAESDTGSSEGNYFMGLVFGVLFALGGAAVYGSIKYFLDTIPFMGWLAGWGVLLVGFLAGKGVDRGYKGGNLVAGLTAAGITLGVTIFTHLAVLAAILAPVVKEAIDEAAAARDDDQINQLLIDEEFKKRDIDPYNATDEQETAVYQAVDQRVKAMSDKQYYALEAKAEMHAARQELIEYRTDEILKDKKIDPDDPPDAELRTARVEAEKEVTSMSDTTVGAKLRAAEAKAEKEFEEAYAKADAADANSGGGTSAGGTSSADDSKGIGGSIIGFAILLGIGFLIWLYFPVLVAMAVAYKVAANA